LRIGDPLAGTHRQASRALHEHIVYGDWRTLEGLRNSLKTYLLLIATKLAVFRSAPISQFSLLLPTSVRRIWLLCF
jgi:hypothetical protein